MSTKLHLRVGDVEFSLESDNAISVADARAILEQVHEVAKSVSQAKPKVAELQYSSASEDGVDPAPAKAELLDLHVNSVAEQLGAKSGSEVAMAAAAHLQLVDGRESFSRKELLDTMKEATNYYSQSMSGNLTKILKALVGSKLTQLKNDHYSIKAAELSSLKTKLA